jgi:hypothetical protein
MDNPRLSIEPTGQLPKIRGIRFIATVGLDARISKPIDISTVNPRITE